MVTQRAGERKRAPRWAPLSTIRAVFRLPDLRVDRFDLRVEVNRVLAQLAAEARLLVAAERRHRVDLTVRVDPNGAGLQLARDAERAVDVLGPDRGGQAVARVVALEDDVGFILELDRRGDRAKDFFARDLHLVVNAGENRRLDEVAGFLLASLAAGLGGRALFLADLEIALDAIVLLLGNQRPHAGVRVQWIAERQAASDLRQFVGELIVHAFLHEHARSGAADL